MPFTGKATYTAGSNLPEIAEDVSDLVAINSPHETPLLDALGDGARPARSTVHEWLEDELLPNTDRIDQPSFNDPDTDTEILVRHPERFRIGDQIRNVDGQEIMLVTGVDITSAALTVQRQYGGSTATALADEQTLLILGNAALEGADADVARFTTRTRRVNYTQIFSSTVEVSGTELAVRQLAIADELDYQKHQRTRELLRDLENTVINGRAAGVNPEGSASVRRTMKGLLGFISTHRFVAGTDSFPADTTLTEEQLNLALREVWQGSTARIDLVVVGGREKRAINQFIASDRRFTSRSDTFKDLVSVYESDFGVCRVVLSRSVPPGQVLLLDSSRIDVLPLSGRSFHYKPLGRNGDRESGQLIGEYTLELRNENAHGVIRLL
jgi:hypothetical protein